MSHADSHRSRSVCAADALIQMMKVLLFCAFGAVRAPAPRQFQHDTGTARSSSCQAVDAPSSLSPDLMRSRYLGRLPVLLPASISPATGADHEDWSVSGLLRRHADTAVVLGTNASLATHGEAASARTPTTLRQYLHPDNGTVHEPGYLFLTGSSRPGGAPWQTEGASRLLEEVRTVTRRWRAASSELGRLLPEPEAGWEPVLAVGGGGGGGGGATGSDRADGIPFHRHFEAWLLLLHGAKRWHLYPPTIPPPQQDISSSHSHRVDTVLPSLSAELSPYECVQRPGETLYHLRHIISMARTLDC
eukprot:SAG25_NODE_36_length_19907_cov_10.787027_1_plen_304_part_00